MIRFYSAAFVERGQLYSDTCIEDMTPKEASELLDRHESIYFKNSGFVPVRFKVIDDEKAND